MSAFDDAFNIVVGVEGGYESPDQAIENHDAGGETSFGISKRQYPTVDIKNLTEDDAKAIYRRDYWDVVHGDQLPWPLCCYVFDAAVNQGCDAAAGYAAQKMLQRALDVAQDGILGPDTMSKAAASRPWHASRFMAFRTMRYIGTRNFDNSGQGWFIRLYTVVAKANLLTQGR